MKAIVKKEAYNGQYRLEEGQEIEYREGRKGMIEVRLAFKGKFPKCALWSEFKNNVI